MSENGHKLVETYERFAEKTQDFLSQSKDKTSEAVEHAMEQARESLEKAEDLTKAESERLKAFLKRDLEQTAKDFNDAGEFAQAKFNPHNIKSGFFNLVAYVAKHSSELFKDLADWADNEVSLHTGEITGPATLACRSCEEELHFENSGRIPPCPKCHKTDFQRVR